MDKSKKIEKEVIQAAMWLKETSGVLKSAAARPVFALSGVDMMLVNPEAFEQLADRLSELGDKLVQIVQEDEG